jgi:hypothetical protein
MLVEKRRGREADHLSLCSAVVQSKHMCTATFSYAFMSCAGTTLPSYNGNYATTEIQKQKMEFAL